MIDDSMSCSNIGARRKRNIRDHIFVLNSVLHEIEKSKQPLDAEIFGVSRCFDKMWAHKTSNNIYEAGLVNDQFVLMSRSIEKCEVYVKTQWGSLCEKFDVENVEMQGGVLAPLRCSVQIDSLGQDIMSDLTRNRELYRYMNCVPIPPMAMIDDVITITECGPSSIVLKATVQSEEGL